MRSSFENAEKARISRQLVLLDDKVKLDVSLDELAVHEPDARKLIAFLKAMEFSSLTRRVSEYSHIDPADVEAFVADQSPNAYEKVVDRLLASPRYGEHRAHYWLDAARYGDTHGIHSDNFRSMWPYRDYVVRAFNQNKPFDQFAVEQLAGDPFRAGDYVERYENGRPIQVVVVGRCAVFFWADHLVKVVKVVDLKSAGR